MAKGKSTKGQTTIYKACSVKSNEKKVNIDETTTTTYNNIQQRSPTTLQILYMHVYVDCLWPMFNFVIAVVVIKKY
jgi:hypothetical protein